MTTQVEVPRGRDELTELIRFHERVYDDAAFRWEQSLDLLLPILLGESPFSQDREFRPFVARQGGEIRARCAALVDQRYIRHWNEPIGHIVLFEALPGALEPAREVLDAASEWLRSRGMDAARTGFSFATFDMPFVIDAYDVVPPSMLRHNPPAQHTMVKRAGFESEQGFVDYKARVTPELTERWQRALDGARRSGFEIVPLRDVPESQRVADFGATFRDTFKAHWGWTPVSDAEWDLMFDAFAAQGVLDTSVLAYRDGAPVGVLLVVADDASHLKLSRARTLRDEERLNILGIGVREAARGRGVNYAMAGYAFLELARRGQSHVSYTLVLDHNWASRRTGEGLGSDLCANYLAYRRGLRR